MPFTKTVGVTWTPRARWCFTYHLTSWVTAHPAFPSPVSFSSACTSEAGTPHADSARAARRLPVCSRVSGCTEVDVNASKLSYTARQKPTNFSGATRFTASAASCTMVLCACHGCTTFWKTNLAFPPPSVPPLRPSWMVVNILRLKGHVRSRKSSTTIVELPSLRAVPSGVLGSGGPPAVILVRWGRTEVARGRRARIPRGS
mmetsp:Transcript_8107/g.23862  ORF Transcript_8107/g.23862 Transcript_8107/m.23862 type:complete len:202 (+) Transcript_8107:306-911(+)